MSCQRAIALLILFLFAALSAPAKPGDEAPAKPPKVKLTPEQKYSLEIRQALEVASDEEWAVLEPRILRVSALARQLRDVRDPKRALENIRPSRSRDSVASELPRYLMELLDRAGELRAALANPSTRPPEFQYYVTMFRKARTVAETETSRELAKARSELRELLTTRQETALIMRGILD